MMTISNHPVRNAVEPPPPVPQRRPFGVRMIIALFLLKVTLTVVVLLALYMEMRTAASEVNLTQALAFDVPDLVISFILLLPLNLVAAIGLWRRKRWAWVLTMVLIAYSMVLDISSYGRGQPLYVSMLLNVIQVGYLNQKEVQALFHTPDQAVTT